MLEEKRSSALDWIYPENVSLRHDEIRRLRQKNTGEWLLKSLQFKKLMERRDANFLWGYGIRTLNLTPIFLRSVLTTRIIFNSWRG